MERHLAGLALALLSAVSLGVSNFLYKKSSAVLSPVNTTFFYYCFSLLIAAVVWGIYGERERITTASLVWPLLIAVFLFVSVLSFNFAVLSLDISFGATIRALSFIVTVLLGVLVYRERVTPRLTLAVFLAVAAIVVAGTEKRQAPKAGDPGEHSEPQR